MYGVLQRKMASRSTERKPGLWHNSTEFVFYASGCPFDPELKHTCREVTGHHAGHQEVVRCSTRGGSWGMYITFASTKENKVEPTLALKHRGDITKNPKQGTSGPKIGHVYVSANNRRSKEVQKILTESC